MTEYKGSIQISYPETENPLGKAPLANKIKKLLYSILAAVLIAGLLAYLGYALGENWLMTAAYILGGLSILGGLGSALTTKLFNYCFLGVV
jgi:hypothetical protein